MSNKYIDGISRRVLMAHKHGGGVVRYRCLTSKMAMDSVTLMRSLGYNTVREGLELKIEVVND